MLETWALILAGSLLAALLLVVLQAHAHGHLWGTKTGPGMMVGEGAYRRAEVAAAVRRGTPKDITFRSVLAAVWGVLTVVVFAPSEILLATLNAQYDAAAFLTYFGLAIALSGVVLGVALIVTAARLLRRGEASVAEARGIAIYSHLHHVATWIGFTIAMALMAPTVADAAGLSLALCVPCGLGILAGAALGSAAQRVAMLEAEEDAA